ncbi:retrovirus-related Pol polyprotein from transposon opus [Trichonephila clavipes]|uniref:Retrovirus-related Pol polyprotein from transposon opus n=1 Tax=Trichonephila clavipes TaxID=2585209 RepID=A0A8X6RYI3_TRICX|nr:retrovirus-related Pol polyprotein from transposon opus [Trichonephila clavipes]
MINDEEIVTSVLAESDPVDDETDENEDNNNESSKGPSNAGTFSALETAMEWYEQQSECCPTQLLLLKRIRDLAVKKRRFPRNTADDQVPLHDLCKGKLKKDNSTIEWLNETKSAFEKCKNSIVQATDLAYSKMEADLSVAVDASDYTIGATLQQNHGTVIEPLSLFSKKLTDTEKGYSTYDTC